MVVINEGIGCGPLVLPCRELCSNWHCVCVEMCIIPCIYLCKKAKKELIILMVSVCLVWDGGGMEGRKPLLEEQHQQS